MAEKFVGIQTQIYRNNLKSTFLLMGFPLLILAAVYAFFYFMLADQYGQRDVGIINDAFVSTIPGVLIAVGIWFGIAYLMHNRMISKAAGSRPLTRKENMRVYNLTENLCISKGMKMPKINIIEDQALNAFASGINESTYTVTLTRGIMEKLNDEELEGVIAHELMHIRNRDVRLLIVSIIFVGIFSFVAQILYRNMLYGSMMGRRRDKNQNNAMLIAMVIAFVAFLLSMVFRFAISRKREYMADSGAAEMTKNPRALASALRKISGNYQVRSVKSDDVAELFIENRPDKSSGLMAAITGLFATHPPIEKRIKFLEQF
ncbi:M48 family metallopeptidase [Litoribacter alkaliphilus]|uniref:Protease HtpX homolog n=1 Tax=Litoribacter ruber TaxID=702568 RepID=A0AAP2G5M0_9BACT|nr:M48 family metallopeptidase [Litoribacter alkaliphilus]MBS9525231.1 M48 family metallopeptidase [Litoribacter alkaliphilus]